MYSQATAPAESARINPRLKWTPAGVLVVDAAERPVAFIQAATVRPAHEAVELAARIDWRPDEYLATAAEIGLVGVVDLRGLEAWPVSSSSGFSTPELALAGRGVENGVPTAVA